jgi:hypothetical protein
MQQQPTPLPALSIDNALNDNDEDINILLNNLKLSVTFINHLKDAILDEDGLHLDILQQLCNPT